MIQENTQSRTSVQSIVHRPILFRGPMVRAILEGRKTQTRRIVKHQPHSEHFEVCNYHESRVSKDGMCYPSDEELFGICDSDGEWSIQCPYGRIGDRLWVRETARATATEEGIDCIHYMADDHCRSIMVSEYGAWRKMRAYGGGHARSVPSIHMPRWASRITLEITSVRVERLNAISETDAAAEGIVFGTGKPNECRTCAKGAFMDLWNAINGKDSWLANPWVWVVAFEVV